MAVYRVMNIQSWTDSMPRDSVVNVMHFLTNAALSQGDLDDLAADVNAVFKTFNVFSARGHHTKVYDIEDAEPRPIIAQHIVAPTGSITATGNRDVACCLSFYSGRNLPRQRGRLFIGPWDATSAGMRQPSATIRNDMASIATGLAAAGPANCQWAIYSRVEDTARAVTNWYVDNEWDTQRRRGMRPDSRTAGTVTA